MQDLERETESLKTIGLRSIQVWAWKPSYHTSSWPANKQVESQSIFYLVLRA